MPGQTATPNIDPKAIGYVDQLRRGMEAVDIALRTGVKHIKEFIDGLEKGVAGGKRLVDTIKNVAASTGSVLVDGFKGALGVVEKIKATFADIKPPKLDIKPPTDAFDKAFGAGKIKAAADEFAKLKAAIESGAYRKYAEEMVHINAELAKVQEAARRIDLEAKFGKFGASMRLAVEATQPLVSFLAKIGSVGVNAVNSLTASLRGYARAGLEGTGIGVMLSYHTQQLARSVTAMFMPAFQAMIDIVQRLTGFFRRLTEGQQNALMGLAAGLGVAKVAAFALGGPIGLIAGAITALTLGSRNGQGTMGQLGQTFDKLLNATRPLLDLLGRFFTAALEKATPLIRFISDAIQGLESNIRHLINTHGESIGQWATFAATFGGFLIVAPRVIAAINGIYTAIKVGLLSSGIGAPLVIVGVLLGLAAASEQGRSGLAKLWDVARPLLDTIGKLAATLLDILTPGLTVVSGSVGTLLDANKLLLDQLSFLITKFNELADAMNKVQLGNKGLATWIGDLTFRFPQTIADALLGIAGQENKKSGTWKAGSLSGKDEDKTPGRQLTQGGGHFEDIRAQFKRIQEAPLIDAKAAEEKRIADAATGILALLREKLGDGKVGGWIDGLFKPPALPRPQGQ